jgi:hypothetical protein
MIFGQLNIQSIDKFEVDEGSQVKVKVIVLREGEVSKLEDPEELEPNDLTRKQ